MQKRTEHKTLTSQAPAPGDKGFDSLPQKLTRFAKEDILILGIGSTLKGDDGFGPAVCEILKPLAPSQVIDAAATPENYIRKIIDKNPRCLLLIDAVDFAAAPGTVSVFAPEKLSFATFSTHAPSPRLFLDMICREINPRIYIIAAQPASTTLAAPLSPQMHSAVEKTAVALTRILKP